MTQKLNHYFQGRETGSLNVGNVKDDLIVIEGCLKSNEHRAYAKIVITHNGNDCIMDLQMMPYKEIFQNFFTGVRFELSDIELDYNANNVGQMVEFKGTITNY